MRLLLLTPGFAASEQDYNCIPPLQLYVRAMQKRGFEIQIVSFEYPFRDEPQDWFGAPVVSANGQNRRWLRWRTWSRVFRYAGQMIRTQKPDLIHSFWLGPAWVIGDRLARKWNIPHWTTLMGQDARSSNRYLRRLRPGHTPRLIALSPFHAEVFQKNTGLTAAHLIPWGVDADETPRTQSRERPIDILGVGSLIPVKNWEKWLQCVAIVRKSEPAIRAELIGEGPLLQHLKKKAHEWGLADTVRFTGSLPRPEVMTRMCMAKVLLHTSDYESFGFILPEAAMNGCRLVSTPVGIGPEMAECADKPEQLAALALNAIRQPFLQEANLPFTIEKAADDYQRLFLEDVSI
ncbi:MAG TPA: glycosyltransferase [Saprospiraceae bacterium]|nr:glycosyltransferase [Saprospiraceae bacterium]HPI09001.1 glycosyltransferase [Saprospiraceae bacterium]